MLFLHIVSELLLIFEIQSQSTTKIIRECQKTLHGPELWSPKESVVLGDK